MTGDAFVSATLSGAIRSHDPGADRVTVRPVDLATGRHVQVTTKVGARTTAANVPAEDWPTAARELLGAGFASVHVRTLTADLQLTHSRRGVPRVIRHAPSATTIDTTHDRSRHRALDGAPFLAACGISDRQGRVKPTARAKYRQVERFVEILSHTLPDDLGPRSALRVVDLGCGAGVLTLATFHYLHHVRGLDVTMTGVDTKRELMDRLAAVANDLGWHGLGFEAAPIASALPDARPELVLALHACDTATDDALARAIGWETNWILAAPCCQHDLQAQMKPANAPAALSPLLRDGIVRERLGDLLTDSLRAEILRAHGYRTDVIEFVSTEHTAKNLLIRASRTGRPDAGATLAATTLADAWGVVPALARRAGFEPGRPIS